MLPLDQAITAAPTYLTPGASRDYPQGQPAQSPSHDLVGFTTSVILLTSSRTSWLNWSRSGPEEGQGASSSDTILTVAGKSWWNDKTLSAKQLTYASQQIARPWSFCHPCGRKVIDLIVLSDSWMRAHECNRGHIKALLQRPHCHLKGFHKHPVRFSCRFIMRASPPLL